MSQLTVRSKKEAVYDWILERIIDSEFAPNTPLVIDEISRMLSVSQIPVREAFQQLEAEGFVTIRPYAGAIVADLKPSMVIEIFGFLEASELISGRMACTNMCEATLRDIETQLQKMDLLVDDVDSWSEENKEFHKMICRCSGASLTEDILDRMLLHWDRLRRYYLVGVFGKRIKKAHADHWAMFDAIKAQDSDRLSTIIRDHNQSALQDYITYLQQSGHTIEQLSEQSSTALEISLI